MPKKRRQLRRVTFVSGLVGYASHKYRVTHHVDALRRLGVEATAFAHDALDSAMPVARDTDVVVLYRVAWSEPVARFVSTARGRGARIVYDTDDHVFDLEVANDRFVDGLRFLPAAQLPEYRRGVELYREALLACDAAIMSTETLADAARRLGKPALVLRNGFDETTLALCRELRAAGRPPGPIRIGYASGTLTHQKDFAAAAPALARLLAARPDVVFTVIGSLALDEFPELRPFATRIERLPLVDHDDLPRSLAVFDVNLAPLEVGNPYCEAKSNLKYYEAALLEIPTVASPTQPFVEAIRSGENGFLAGSDDEWLQALTALVDDRDLRRAIGQRARAHAEATYGPSAKQNMVRDTFGAVRALASEESRAVTDTASKRPSGIVAGLSIVAVSAYLLLVLAFLLVTRRLPGEKKWLRSMLRRRYKGPLAEVGHEQGLCFVAPVPHWLMSDNDGVSRLVVLEDGVELPLGHSPHEDIRALGSGRYSHWGPTVYFSAPDNADPRTSGRRYTVREQASRAG